MSAWRPPRLDRTRTDPAAGGAEGVFLAADSSEQVPGIVASAEPMSQGAATLRLAARAAHRAGRLDEARTGYERALARLPDDADTLGLLGVLALQDGRIDEAERHLLAALDIPGTDDRIALRNANNLLTLYNDTLRQTDARELVGRKLPLWPRGAVPTPAERATIMSLATGCGLYFSPEAGRALLASAMEHFSDDPRALCLAGRLSAGCGEPEAALRDLEAADGLAPGDPQTGAAIAMVLDMLGEREAAIERSRAVAAMVPSYSAPALPGHEASVLVVNPAPTPYIEANDGHFGLHFRKNHIGIAAVQSRARVRFHSVYGDLPGAMPDLPAADVLFNNLASGEQMNRPGALEQAMSIVERAGLPVLNHPRGVHATTRQKTAALLRDVPGLVVPRIARFARNLERLDVIMTEIERDFRYPVIVRHVFSDQSSNSMISDVKTVFRADDAGELRRILHALSWPQFYIIQYIDLQKPEGHWRKLRAAFIGQECFVVHGGCFDDWIVAGWMGNKKGIDFYDGHPHLFDGLMNIVRDPGGTLGHGVLDVLQAIRARIPLDTLGMDFDVDDQGRVVLFEAQATMVYRQSGAVPRRLLVDQDLRDRTDDLFCQLIIDTAAGRYTPLDGRAPIEREPSEPVPSGRRPGAAARNGDEGVIP